jgi:hypothetical protein
MKKDIWVVLVHYPNGTTNISNESYTTYDEAVERLCKRIRADGHWVDSYNFITIKNYRYELKNITVKI